MMIDEDEIQWFYKVKKGLAIQKGTVVAPDRKSAQQAIRKEHGMVFWICLHPEDAPMRRWEYTIHKRNRDPSAAPTLIDGIIEAVSETEARNELIVANWTDKDKIVVELRPADN